MNYYFNSIAYILFSSLLECEPSENMGSCLLDLCILSTECTVVSGLVSPCGRVSCTHLTLLKLYILPQAKKRNSFKYHIVLSDHTLIILCRERETTGERETKEVKIWALKYLRLRCWQFKVFFPRF